MKSKMGMTRRAKQIPHPDKLLMRNSFAEDDDEVSKDLMFAAYWNPRSSKMDDYGDI